MPEPVSDSGNRLLVISADYRAYLELLRPQAPKDLPIRGCDSLQDGRRQARSCNIILGDPNLVAGVLEHADRLPGGRAFQPERQRKVARLKTPQSKPRKNGFLHNLFR